MAVPNLVPGYQFLLLRGNGDGPPETFTYLCTVTTRGLDETNEFDDAMLQDCDSPGLVPSRVSVPKGQTWQITFSGKVDATRLQVLQNDMRSAVLRTYQLQINFSGAQGGGYYQGEAYPETLKIESSENGITTFSGTLRGQGALPAWTAAP